MVIFYLYPIGELGMGCFENAVALQSKHPGAAPSRERVGSWLVLLRWRKRWVPSFGHLRALAKEAVPHFFGGCVQPFVYSLPQEEVFFVTFSVVSFPKPYFWDLLLMEEVLLHPERTLLDLVDVRVSDPSAFLFARVVDKNLPPNITGGLLDRWQDCPSFIETAGQEHDTPDHDGTHFAYPPPLRA